MRKLCLPLRFIGTPFFLFLVVSFFTRILLLSKSFHSIQCNGSLLGSFAWGALFDIAAASFACLPWILLFVITPQRLWKSRYGSILYALLLSLYLFTLIFISTSEWFFWDEFEVRFNFIAVDYLVFTTEVIENIMQSYPMVWIFCGMTLIAAAVVNFLRRRKVLAWSLTGENHLGAKLATAAFTIGTAFLAFATLQQSHITNFSNQYHTELAKNGCWSFFAAYQKMEIEYEQWYATIPNNEARINVQRQLATSDTTFIESGNDKGREIKGKPSEQRWNVIVICMESMSADFMKYAGNQKGLTPELDQLAKESLFFSNLRATGTRTVRGMEALTLNLPPTPGQAIFYRPSGVDLQTTFQPFLERNYDCAFIYGGHGQFDYMNRYFSTSGCRLMDLGEWKKEDVTMKTAWGACDEDLFHKTIAEADVAFAEQRPFHYFCMTTSNHRPYDFPDGRIDLKSHTGRNAAVKYSDWAIGDLISRAKSKPWFANTLFVICSDHCASSSGKVELNVVKYHIPAMIYAPSLVKPQVIDQLASQIDVMPTVYGLLGWEYQSMGFGLDLLNPENARKPGRAFVSNYQKIALMTDDKLMILKPNRQHSLYRFNQDNGDLTAITDGSADAALTDTISYYQYASWLFTQGKLKRDHVIKK